MSIYSFLFLLNLCACACARASVRACSHMSTYISVLICPALSHQPNRLGKLAEQVTVGQEVAVARGASAGSVCASVPLCGECVKVWRVVCVRACARACMTLKHALPHLTDLYPVHVLNEPQLNLSLSPEQLHHQCVCVCVLDVPLCYATMS